MQTQWAGNAESDTDDHAPAAWVQLKQDSTGMRALQIAWRANEKHLREPVAEGRLAFAFLHTTTKAGRPSATGS